MGILGGIVVFGVGTFRTDSAQAACQAESDTVKVAAQAYKAKNAGAIPGTDDPARIGTLVTDGYLESTPTYVANITVTGGGVVANTCSSLT